MGPDAGTTLFSAVWIVSIALFFFLQRVDLHNPLVLLGTAPRTKFVLSLSHVSSSPRSSTPPLTSTPRQEIPRNPF